MDNQDIFKTAGLLLDYIRENHLQRGDLLPPEKILAETLQLSRVVLRESLSCLKALNLVSSRRGSGYRIAAGTLAGAMAASLHASARSGLTELSELYELRRTLEIGALADAVANADESDKQELYSALKDLEAITTVDSEENLELYTRAELRFHRALLKPARCTVLEIINQSLEDFFNFRNTLSQNPIRMDQDLVKRTHLTHRALADAFNLGEASAALLILRSHLTPITSDKPDNKP